jgi:hypothetical protein
MCLPDDQSWRRLFGPRCVARCLWCKPDEARRPFSVSSPSLEPKMNLLLKYLFYISSCGSKFKWALVHLCTCKAAANRSNVYVSGKKILPIPETMQGISTSAESKEERSKKRPSLTSCPSLEPKMIPLLKNLFYNTIHQLLFTSFV